LRLVEELRERRRRRLWLLGACAVVAAIVVAIAIGVSQSDSGPTKESLAKDTAETNALLDGIPQEGLSLGTRSAAVTLTEFADLQCPFCREYTEKVFPTLVQRYVRTGKVRMVFRGLSFIGADSIVAARAAGAASRQNRLWQFLDVFYKNQGDENSGYVRPKFLRQIGAAAGLDVVRLERDATTEPVAQLLTDANNEADRFGIKSTPSFLVAKAGGQPQRLKYSSLTPDEFVTKLDAVLAE
jgi:protein-disulfide isomerase